MDSKLINRRDIDFVLYEWLDVEALTSRARFREHSRETFDAILDLAENMARDLFASHLKKSDQDPPRMEGEQIYLPAEVETAVKAHAQAGFISAGFDAEWGGMQLPSVVERAVHGHFVAANVGTTNYISLTVGAARLLTKWASPEQAQMFAVPMLEGRFFGTMGLSEPQAGSSLGDIITRADLQEGRTYRIRGNKMWTTAGDHPMGENIVHMVLAKVPDKDGKLIPGVKGISLFIVPKFLVNEDGTIGDRNDIVLAGLNHKMGHRGSTNTLMNYGEGKYKPMGEEGAVGYLVGEVNEGLACMFHMMNHARTGVGLAATSLGYTGYLHALQYARERNQGRDPNDKDPNNPQIPIIRHTDVKRMLLAQKAYVEGGLGLTLYCAKLIDEQTTSTDDKERIRLSGILDILTPIAKAWPSQWCLKANELAIQVHGGYGYTTDFNVEQYYRDNRINPIHEGTHGVQGLDLLGRKVIMKGGGPFVALLKEIEQTVCDARKTPELTAYGDALDAVFVRISKITQKLHSETELARTLANSSAYLEAFGHAVVAWIWLQQAKVVVESPDRDTDFYRGKLQACSYFFNWELPSIQSHLDILERIDTIPLEMEDAWF